MTQMTNNPTPIVHFPMSARERRMGRMIRDNEGHQAGPVATPPPPADNGGVIPEAPAGDSQDANNNGQADDFNLFWDQQEGIGAEQQQSGEQQQAQQQQADSGLRESVANHLAAMPFTDVFSSDVADALNQGDYSAANEAIKANMQALMKHTMQGMLPVMDAAFNRFDSRVQEQIQGSLSSTLGQRDSEAVLASEFSSQMRDPAVAPIVRNIFAQAMKNNKGDRTKALESTRSLLNHTGTSISTTGRDSEMNGTDPNRAAADFAAELISGRR